MKARHALASAVCAAFLALLAVRGRRPRNRPRPVQLLPEAERSWLARPLLGATATTTGPVTGLMPYRPTTQRQFPDIDLMRRVLRGLRALD